MSDPTPPEGNPQQPPGAAPPPPSGTPPPPGAAPPPPGGTPPPPGAAPPPPGGTPPPGMPPAQPGGFQPAAAPYGAQPPSAPNNTMAIVSLVLGILGLLTFWACGGGALLGIGAVVLGILGLNKAKEMNGNGRGLAIGGIATGALAIIAGVLIFFAWVVFADSVNDQIQEDFDEWEQQLDEIDSDPPDGSCDLDRFLEDPDC